MVTTDRFEEAAAIIVDVPGAGGSTLEGIESVMQALALLRDAGFAVVLLPRGASVRVRHRRRWWRPERKERA